MAYDIYECLVCYSKYGANNCCKKKGFICGVCLENILQVPAYKIMYALNDTTYDKCCDLCHLQRKLLYNVHICNTHLGLPPDDTVEEKNDDGPNWYDKYLDNENMNINKLVLDDGN